MPISTFTVSAIFITSFFVVVFVSCSSLCFELYLHAFEHECLNAGRLLHEVVRSDVMPLENDVEQSPFSTGQNQFFAVSSMLI